MNMIRPSFETLRNATAEAYYGAGASFTLLGHSSKPREPETVGTPKTTYRLICAAAMSGLILSKIPQFRYGTLEHVPVVADHLGNMSHSLIWGCIGGTIVGRWAHERGSSNDTVRAAIIAGGAAVTMAANGIGETGFMTELAESNPGEGRTDAGDFWAGTAVGTATAAAAVKIPKS